LGGVGYSTEYPVEQYLRDSKILTIWEGTSFIHANDLIGRKMRMKEGASFARWLASIREFIDANMNAKDLEKEMKNLAKGYQALTEVKSTYDSWWGNLEAKRQLIPLNAVRALFVCFSGLCGPMPCGAGVDCLSKTNVGKKRHKRSDILRRQNRVRQILLEQHTPQAFLTTELIKSEENIVLNLSGRIIGCSLNPEGEFP